MKKIILGLITVCFCTLVFVGCGHICSFDERTITLNPTCEDSGIITYSCSCGKAYTEEIPALGHDWNDGEIILESTCESEGEMEYICNRCKETKFEAIKKLDHVWDEGDIIKEPTRTENGETKYTCVNCNTTKTEIINKLPADTILVYYKGGAHTHLEYGSIATSTAYNTFEITDYNFNIDDTTLTIRYKGKKRVNFTSNPNSRCGFSVKIYDSDDFLYKEVKHTTDYCKTGQEITGTIEIYGLDRGEDYYILFDRNI